MPTYLVERYWPGATTGRLHKALEQGHRVMEEMSVQGQDIRDISCTLLPSEEVVFSVYEGPTAIAVQQLNERSGIPFSRIVEAIVVTQDKKTW